MTEETSWLRIWEQHWRHSGWKIGENSEDLAASGLGMPLEKERLRKWGQNWRPSGWKIGDDVGDLAARGLGTMPEPEWRRNWAQNWRPSGLGKIADNAGELAVGRLGMT